MNTVTYSEARNNLKHICDRVQASHDVTRIVRKNGDVILLSAEDWESIEETLHLINRVENNQLLISSIEGHYNDH